MLLQNDVHIATLGADSVVKLFNRFTLTLENAVKCEHDFDVNAMAFTQKGELLVTCRSALSRSSPVSLSLMTLNSYSDWKLWDTRDSKLVESFDGHRSDVTGIAINSKGTGGYNSKMICLSHTRA